MSTRMRRRVLVKDLLPKGTQTKVRDMHLLIREEREREGERERGGGRKRKENGTQCG